MSVKHVLFVLTNAAEIGPNHRATGYFYPEVAHPYEVFDEAGIAVEFASPLGGNPPFDGYDANDPSQVAFSKSAAIRRMAHSRKLSEVDVLDYDAIFFPGGLGPMVDIATDPDVKAAVLRAWNGGKIVSAVCHGPVALLGVNLDDGTPLIQGRKLTSFSNAEEEGYAKADVPFLLEDALRAAGAEYSSTDVWQAKVVVDGRLITGQNPASGGPMAEAVVAALNEVRQ
ncbi:type 1 glutamine amidotransferase domain-containing protein [Paucibacter sp. R3-3]|uniref:Type 1 glutamine amidotransferase domain-containing protein n=1 Tax=Roseateles agri TaxID=3098619 RepID=A0ABU5DDD6_9BURK|nr:type 1 glutamine amidotransferase domain-containing protein [Paucibacter sp. R3-3]MDY0744144.1 type 1 glutamine amidotransferase domain-containing protein [Paucibacter sp. R3-3]